MTTPKSHTKGKKTARTQKKDFENVLHDLSIEQQEVSTVPNVHKTLFIVTGFVTAIAPVVLFLSPVYLLALGGLGSKNSTSASIYDGKVLEKLNWIYYATASVVSGFILVAAMNILALKRRKYLFISREPVFSSDEAVAGNIKSALKQLNATESSSYSIFIVNTLYLGTFLLFVGYVLPTYELTEQSNYLAASLLSAFIVFPLSTLLLPMFTIALLSLISATVALKSSPAPRSINSALNVRSKSVPFLDQPPALTGKLAGDVGFDPLGLSSYWADKDWSQQIVPDIWPEAAPRTPITTLEWFRESELKHGRLAMLAVLGWVAVDAGLRFPGEAYSAIPNSLAAHTAAVQNGSMGFLLFVVSFLEIVSGAAVYDQAKGSGRASGEFNFDPLGFSKDAKSRERYQTNEIKNGRLAMLAFSGIVTQAALFPDKAFPYL